MGAQHFGIVGLGVMGENLAQNIERNGFSVAGYDLDAGKVDSFAKATTGKKAAATRSLEEFLGALAVPRRILMMVPAGKPVDAVIDSLRPHLQAGDVLIDGGNTYFADTVRRIAAMRRPRSATARASRRQLRRWRPRRPPSPLPTPRRRTGWKMLSVRSPGPSMR